MRRTLVIVLATAIVGGLAGASIGLAFNKGDSTTSAQPTASSARAVKGLDAEQIYRSDSPGVVVITDSQTQIVPASFFSPAQKEQVTALGSGFVIDKRGDIVTNDHVVQGAKDIRVGFSGGASYPAKIVGSDPSTDIAVVRVKGAPDSLLRPLRFADSGVQVGDPAYAIGNPFGLERTMTAGIVSATGRDIQAPNGLVIANAIQTDAPINHGNSGGPLLDRVGEVIGINSQIQGGTVDANVGVGFAIPSATARSVSEQLIATGHAEHAWLGVEVAAIDPSVATSRPRSARAWRRRRQGGQGKPCSQGRSQGRHAAGDRERSQRVRRRGCHRGSRRQARLLHRAARRRRCAAQAGRPARARGRSRREEPNGRDHARQRSRLERGGVR